MKMKTAIGFVFLVLAVVATQADACGRRGRGTTSYHTRACGSDGQSTAYGSDGPVPLYAPTGGSRAPTTDRLIVPANGEGRVILEGTMGASPYKYYNVVVGNWNQGGKPITARVATIDSDGQVNVDVFDVALTRTIQFRCYSHGRNYAPTVTILNPNTFECSIDVTTNTAVPYVGVLAADEAEYEKGEVKLKDVVVPAKKDVTINKGQTVRITATGISGSTISAKVTGNARVAVRSVYIKDGTTPVIGGMTKEYEVSPTATGVVKIKVTVKGPGSTGDKEEDYTITVK